MEAQQPSRQQQQQQQQQQHGNDSDVDIDLEQLSLVDIEAAMSMSVTDAMFSSVLAHYPVGAHIQCRCQVTDPRDLSAGCWIGLFKVGWASADADCVCRAECRREGERTLVAVFTQTQLPRDTRDFYQFCFVAPDGLVKGASSPFLFRAAPVDDFVAELDEELQGVVVSASNAQLQNTLANMRLEHEAQRSAAEDEAEQLRGRLAALEAELRDAVERDATAAEARHRLERRAADAESDAGRLRAELESLDGARQSTAARLVGAEDERQRLQHQLEEATREVESANDQAEAARKTLAMHVEERQRLSEQCARDRAAIGALEERLRRAELELEDARDREQRLLELVDRAEASAEASQTELASERAARQQQELAAEQLRAQLAARQHQLDAQEEAAATAGPELRAQQARYASLLTAYEGVKGQFHAADERERLVRLKYDEVIACNRQMLQREERLHARLAELQARLKEGASEYKRLLRRFKDQQLQLQAADAAAVVAEAGEPAEPEEFHDAESDAQQDLLLADRDADEDADASDVIHRPPAATTLDDLPPVVDGDSCWGQQSAAAAVGNSSEQQQQEQQKACPVCGQSGFAEQREFEEHVYGHF